MKKRGRPKLSHLEKRERQKKLAELADVRLTKRYGFRRSRFALAQTDMKDAGYFKRFIRGPVVKTPEQIEKENKLLEEERRIAEEERLSQMQTANVG